MAKTVSLKSLLNTYLPWHEKIEPKLKKYKGFLYGKAIRERGSKSRAKNEKKKKERKNREKNNRRGELNEEDFGEEISKCAYRIFTINARHLLNAGFEKTPGPNCWFLNKRRRRLIDEIRFSRFQFDKNVRKVGLKDSIRIKS